MTALSPAAAAAIARLRSYVPPPTTWYSLPLTRRAAVSILLFADKRGELRVVLTMRASTLKSYSGQAALPGGKTDSLAETPLQTARREAWEEIGLPIPLYPRAYGDHGDTQRATPADAEHDILIEEDSQFSPDTPALPFPFKIEHLCQLPTNLAKTELGVRPVVAFLHATAPTDKHGRPVDVESVLIPTLDPREVAAVFSAPFHNFLLMTDEEKIPGAETGPPDPTMRPERPKGREAQNPPDRWYLGGWTGWHETRWRMHNFYVPVKNQIVTRPNQQGRDTADDDKQPRRNQKALYPRMAHGASVLPYRDHPPKDTADPLEKLNRFRVWGMTARILVDCARIAYDSDPEFEHNSHFGDEAIIQKLLDVGRFGEARKKGAEFRGEDLRRTLGGGASNL